MCAPKHFESLLTKGDARGLDFVVLDHGRRRIPYFEFLDALASCPELLQLYHELRMLRIRADDKLNILKEAVGACAAVPLQLPGLRFPV